MNTKTQGDVGLGVAIGYFAKNLQRVSVPLTDNQEYDLVVDFNGSLKKVQVKTTNYQRNGHWKVQLKTSGGNQSGAGKIKKFDGSAVDYLFVYCFDGNSYLIPTNEDFPTSEISLTSYQQYLV